MGITPTPQGVSDQQFSIIRFKQPEQSFSAAFLTSRTEPLLKQSHTARCVRKKASARFAGAWGVPNKQSKNAAGGRAVDKNIRKGYFYPLLAADLRITRTWTFLRIIIRNQQADFLALFIIAVLPTAGNIIIPECKGCYLLLKKMYILCLPLT